MKSNQINFYLSQKDIAELESYILSSGLEIILDSPESKELVRANSLLSPSDKKFIVRSEDRNKVQFMKTKNHDLFIIDQTISPVIEFWNAAKWENTRIMPRGRVYYSKTFYNSEGTLVKKSPEFLSMADSLFKWIKKHFKNSRIPGFEMFLVSPRTLEWMQEEGETLADIVTSENLTIKKNVA